MNNKKFKADAQSSKRISPQQQLWHLLTPGQKHVIGNAFENLKPRAQEDLCYALIAYIRFRVYRPFGNSFMYACYKKLINVVTKKEVKPSNNIKVK